MQSICYFCLILTGIEMCRQKWSKYQIWILTKIHPAGVTKMCANWQTDATRPIIAFRMRKRLKSSKNSVYSHKSSLALTKHNKTGNVRITYYWVAFTKPLLLWKSCEYFLLVCVYMRARTCVHVVTGRVGVCMRIRVCSLANPAWNAYAPYCDVICGPSYSTPFFDIIS
jgi:hypothetical protein